MKKLFALFALLATASLFLYIKVVYKPYLVVESTRGEHMEGFQVGILQFRDKFHRMPSDLAEVVKEGFLPEQSSLYANPMKRNRLKVPAISFKKCEFELEFTSTTAVIRVPKDVYSQGRFATLPQRWWALKLNENIRLFNPATDR